ncbi:uncharacterized protein Pyn_18073 [Prunus yedoensis var. nudiflora]|uniref:HD/PDEase domain-containing protein n=1 Tax=Prunus yedoensis var. nudiflora TaxID=2094558 RepID=A0A314Y346_PRUYE|nr:uncharacterized protein Pyn_18073 [Prunus yedoensis var. nudiflora]
MSTAKFHGIVRPLLSLNPFATDPNDKDEQSKSFTRKKRLQVFQSNLPLQSRYQVSISVCSLEREKKLKQGREGKRTIGSGGSWEETVRKAEKLVEEAMKDNDASHDAAHVWRVRDLALSLAREEQGLSLPSSNSNTMQIVELAALLHDIEIPQRKKLSKTFLTREGIEESTKMKILRIIKGMGFKDELAGSANNDLPPEFGVVQDADRLDAIGAIGIARCFTFGGSRNRVLHDPNIQPRSDLSKEKYMKKDEQTTVNHFHEKLLQLKSLMKTKAGQRRAERRHKFMEEFLVEFYEEWDGRA